LVASTLARLASSSRALRACNVSALVRGHAVQVAPITAPSSSS
jgi:hypothetical protein